MQRKPQKQSDIILNLRYNNSRILQICEATFVAGGEENGNFNEI